MKALFIQHDHVSPLGPVGERLRQHGFEIETMLVVPEEKYREPNVEVQFPQASNCDSVTNGRKAPVVSMVVGGAIGFLALLSIEVLTAVDAEGAGAVAGAIVLNIAVWGAMLAYMMQAMAFLILRRKLPNMKRPYMSPWGVPGGVLAALIAGLSFVGYLINPAFQTAIAGIAVVYVIMLLIFALYGRHNLVLSPEEQYAVDSTKQ